MCAKWGILTQTKNVKHDPIFSEDCKERKIVIDAKAVVTTTGKQDFI